MPSHITNGFVLEAWWSTLGYCMDFLFLLPVSQLIIMSGHVSTMLKKAGPQIFWSLDLEQSGNFSSRKSHYCCKSFIWEIYVNHRWHYKECNQKRSLSQHTMFTTNSILTPAIIVVLKRGFFSVPGIWLFFSPQQLAWKEQRAVISIHWAKRWSFFEGGGPNCLLLSEKIDQ